MDEETQGTESEDEVEGHKLPPPKTAETDEGEGDDVEAHKLATE
jgi:hypothetical protein